MTLKALTEAFEKRDKALLQRSLGFLYTYQYSHQDDEEIKKLKAAIFGLLGNTDENAELFRFNMKENDELCKKIFLLPSIGDDSEYLQDLRYKAYAKQDSYLYGYSLYALEKLYQKRIHYSQEDLAPQQYEVPKTFHYIWAGDTLPEHLIKNVSAMMAVAKQNGWKVCLWTDDLSKQEKIFNELPPSHREHIEIKLISDLNPLIDQYFNYDLPEFGTKASTVIKSFIQEEMSGFKNYAAMSDLVRILILLFHGGVYLDSDIKLRFDSERDIGYLDIEMGFKQLVEIIKYDEMPFMEERIAERNDMLMSSPMHPILKEAVKIWFALLQEQRVNPLPHKKSNAVDFLPTFKDQRRFGQSFYEFDAKKDMMKGQFRPKELGTGNLGVYPITLALRSFIELSNQKNNTHKTVKDFAFGYKKYFKSPYRNEIQLGNLRFDHVMEHAWLRGKRRKGIDI